MTKKASEPVQDAMKAYLELAYGLTEASKKKAERTVKKLTGELLGKGSATAGQLQHMAEDVLATGLANREALARLVRVELDRALGRVGLATSEEVASLTSRIHELEKELREVKATGAGGPASAPLALGAEADKAAPVPAAPSRTSVAKKAVAKKSLAKKSVATKSVGKGAATGSAGVTAMSSPATEPAAVPPLATETPAKQTPARQTPARQSATKKAAAKQASAKQAPAEPGPAKQAPAKKSVAKKAVAKNAPAKKAAQKQTTPAKPAGV